MNKSLKYFCTPAGEELPVPALPAASQPEVSVIIAVYNNIKLTAECVESISQCPDVTSYEVIIADDDSDDSTAAWCRRVPNLKHIVTGHRQGFVMNNNIASALARGKWILFLNNDTLVRPGWLDALVEAGSAGNVGAVGAKLVYPDGRLQEAGGVIWKNFDGWNYGRNTNPFAPEFNYRRSVDYCSGACLMVRREVWERLGGFWRDLEHSYGEDSDLCFSIRHRLGMEVIYEPRAVVVHLEGQSCGTSTESGIKKYQLINKEKLAIKWAKQVEAFPEATDANAQIGPRKFMGKPTVLLMDHYIPMFDRESGSRRLATILIMLREMGCHVMFLAENLYPQEPYATQIRSLGVELLVSADGYGTTIEELLEPRMGIIDLVWSVRPETTARWMSFIRSHNPSTRIVFDTGDIHHIRMKRQELLDGTFQAHVSPSEKMKEIEEMLCRETDLTIAICKNDVETLRGMGARQVEIVSGIYSNKTGHPDLGFEGRRGLLFIGSYQHTPNVDGMLWFLDQVWPWILREAPDMRLTLLGPNPPESIQQRASPNLLIQGYVPEVDPWFCEARLFICPLLYGAGIKGKLGQCIEHRLPFVSTTCGADGMHFTNELDALIADSPEEFAGQVLRLHEDRELWNRLRQNLAEHLAVYSPDEARKGLQAVLKSIPQSSFNNH